MGSTSCGAVVSGKAGNSVVQHFTHGGAHPGIRAIREIPIRNIPAAGHLGRVGLMRIRIFVGAGGVGKTSVTAASALGTALRQGKHLVLTIDPALRLKTALNLNGTPASTEKIALDA